MPTKKSYSYMIMMQASPFDTLISRHAVEFARAVLSLGHTIEKIFFLGDGVYHGLAYLESEFNNDLLKNWQILHDNDGVDLCLEVEDVKIRGLQKILSCQENLSIFRLASIGQLFEALVISDRCIQFKRST